MKEYKLLLKQKNRYYLDGNITNIKKYLLNRKDVIHLENYTTDLCDISIYEYIYLTTDKKRDDNLIKFLLCGLGFGIEDFVIAPSTIDPKSKLRLILARVLYKNKEEILFLDNPENFLDKKLLFWIVDYIKSKWNGCVVTTSQNIEYITDFCTNVIFVKGKKITQYDGNFDNFFRELGFNYAYAINDPYCV